MIPSPKLDGRTFDELVAEALALIPRYAPEWTSRSPADPGITLLELAAWMTEQVMRRVDQVPERNYVAFLNLLGITQRPPRAARAVVQFSLVDGATRQRVPPGTQVSTPPASDERTVTFETARDVVVSAARPDRCISTCDNSFDDNSGHLDAVGDGFAAFAGARSVERYIYVSDPRFAAVGDGAVLRVQLAAPEHGGRDLARLLEWEHWDGARWRELVAAPLDVERGEVGFAGPLQLPSTTVHHATGAWLRGRLLEVPAGQAATELVGIRARVDIAGDGSTPSHAFANLDSGAFVPLDLGKHVYPFGKEPRVDCVLYLAADDALASGDGHVAIDFQLADPAAIAAPGPSDQLVLAYEMWDGRRWRCFGRATSRGVLPGDGGDVDFHDDTAALSRSGRVGFRPPRDATPVEVCGVTRRWLRVRIETGDYGIPGSYALDGDRWLFRDPRPLRPPALKTIAVRVTGAYRPVAHALAFTDFAFVDLGAAARGDLGTFQPFAPRSDDPGRAAPAMYLGYPACPPVEPIGLYLELDGLGVAGGHRVVWEYASSLGWQPLAVVDETDGFVASGFVWFVPPDDWQRVAQFGDDRFWLRARLGDGGYVVSPRIRLIASNAIDAHHHETIRGELLGSSDGSPLQQFRLLRGPLLAGEVIEVRERRLPVAAALADLGADAVRPDAVDDTGLAGEVWVRYSRVDSLFASGPDSRHYTLDHATGVVAFGDGRRGFVPPALPHNIRAACYAVGGGVSGNVGAGALTSLGRALAYIAGVTNLLAASGGADRETVDDAKLRAPDTVRNRDRAVTAEDYEALALAASTAVARARCLPDADGRPGATVVIVPHVELRDDGDLAHRLVPSPELLRHVARFLDDRRLLGTALAVVKPRYRDVSLRVVLARRGLGVTSSVGRDVAASLRRYLHAVVGGRSAKGWELGAPVMRGELIRVVEQVAGVTGVDAIAIRDENRNLVVDQLQLEPGELPFVAHVEVTDRQVGS